MLTDGQHPVRVSRCVLEHLQVLHEDPPPGDGLQIVVQLVAQIHLDPLDIEGSPKLEQVHQSEEILDLVGVALDELKEDVCQYHHFVLLAYLLDLTVFQLSLPIFKAVDDLPQNLVGQGIEPLEPPVVSVGELQDYL